MSIFHIFKIVQMVPSRAKYHIFHNNAHIVEVQVYSIC